MRCVREAFKNLNVREGSLLKIFSSVFGLQDTGLLFGALKSGIPGQWFPKLLTLRTLGYQALSKPFKCDVLLMMIATELSVPRKHRRKSKSKSYLYYFIQGVVTLLCDLVLYSPSEHVKRLALSRDSGGVWMHHGTGVSAQFRSVRGVKEVRELSEFNVHIRTQCLDVFDELLDWEKEESGVDSDKEKRLMDELNSFLVVRIVFEHDLILKDRIMGLKERLGAVSDEDSDFVGTAFRKEEQSIVGHLDSQWSRLMTDEMLAERQTEEVTEKVLSDFERAQIAREKHHKRDLEAVIPKKEELRVAEEELALVDKQLRHSRAERSAKGASGDEDAMACLEEKKLVAEEKVSTVRGVLTSYELRGADLAKKREEIDDLRKEIAELGESTNELKESLEVRRKSYETSFENYDQVRKDYALAARLQQEKIIDEKRRVLQAGGETVKEAEMIAEVLAQPTEEYDEELPEDFLCPISMDLMQDAVLLPESGQTYERENIERWLSDHDTDPLSGQVLSRKELVPNYAVRRAIETWKGKHIVRQQDTQPVVDE